MYPHECSLSASGALLLAKLHIVMVELGFQGQVWCRGDPNCLSGPQGTYGNILIFAIATQQTIGDPGHTPSACPSSCLVSLPACSMLALHASRFQAVQSTAGALCI